MKIIRYKIGRKTEYGILEGQRVQGLAGTPFRQIRKLDRFHKLSDVRLLAPCLPTKIIAIGLNYYSHAKEVGSPPLKSR